MFDWLILYSNGFKFTSEDGEPQDAPSWGVQIIIEPHPIAGRVLIAKWDYYWYERGWKGSNEEPDASFVKRGTLIDKDSFEVFVRWAKICPGFPKKVKLMRGEP